MTLAEFLRQTHQRPLPAEALDDLKKVEVRGVLCDGDQGWDGSGILPNGERCDLCEKSRRDDKTARDAR